MNSITQLILVAVVTTTTDAFTFPSKSNCQNPLLFGITTPVAFEQERCAAHPMTAAIHHKSNRHHQKKMVAREHNSKSESANTLIETASDEPTPFVDPESGSFIDCYVDSIATIEGIEYSIGSPCDYAVALCYFDDRGELNPVELDAAFDKEGLMDDVFPVAERIVEEEFGEELALVRTPQTLTLVGELELDGEDQDDYQLDEDEMEDGEEEVEILITFEHNGKEYNLVRLLDPVLLVGKKDGNSLSRTLLSKEESDKIMPYLEEMILDYQEEKAGLGP